MRFFTQPRNGKLSIWAVDPETKSPHNIGDISTIAATPEVLKAIRAAFMMGTEFSQREIQRQLHRSTLSTDNSGWSWETKKEEWNPKVYI